MGKGSNWIEIVNLLLDIINRVSYLINCMLKKHFILSFILLGFIVVQLSAQDKTEQFKQGETYLDDGRYHKALDIFLELLREDPNNANLNFKVGYSFLQTATEKAKAVSYLEFAANNISDEYFAGSVMETRAPYETFYFLGQAYHMTYRFKDARESLESLREILSDRDDELRAMIDRELKEIAVAEELVKKPVEMRVTNLGAAINSEEDEHSPVISGDESLLIFTSKRYGSTGNRRMDDGQYFEDIYMSTYGDKHFRKATQLGPTVNTSDHDASIGLSFDGSKLLIYRDEEGNGNIYMSERNGADWSEPVLMPDVINSKYRETHASISYDENEIYFTSDRKGGYGGLDIYRVRKLPDGNWSKAQNLGPQINSAYDEEGPYLHPDGTSLFFASNGHETMGGFDIFVSTYDEDNDSWSKPENLGYPINTPDDNIYYIPSVDGRRAYYASADNNSLGRYDIFRIDLSDSHVRNQTVIAGIAMTASGKMLEDALITISDMDDELVGIYTPDEETGKFLIILPRDKKFFALVESSNHVSMLYELTVPEYAYDQSKKVVVFNDIVRLISPKPVEASPLLADVEADELDDKSISTMDPIVENPSPTDSESQMDGSAAGAMGANDSAMFAQIDGAGETEFLISSAEQEDLETMVSAMVTEDMIENAMKNASGGDSQQGEHIKGVSVGDELSDSDQATRTKRRLLYLAALAALAFIVIFWRKKQNK